MIGGNKNVVVIHGNASSRDEVLRVTFLDFIFRTPSGKETGFKEIASVVW